jgi:hypothetical protein
MAKLPQMWIIRFTPLNFSDFTPTASFAICKVSEFDRNTPKKPMIDENFVYNKTDEAWCQFPQKLIFGGLNAN